MSNETNHPAESVPNARAKSYDADLEREIADALEGMSIEELEQSSASPKGGSRGGGRQVRQGTIIRVHAGDVFVEFGPRSQGVCPLAQFLQVGDKQAPVVGSERVFVFERFDPFEFL